MVEGKICMNTVDILVMHARKGKVIFWLFVCGDGWVRSVDQQKMEKKAELKKVS